MSDGGDEALWIERSKANAAAADKANATFLEKLNAHRKAIGECERCDWWASQGLSPFCPTHEPTNES